LTHMQTLISLVRAMDSFGNPHFAKLRDLRGLARLSTGIFRRTLLEDNN
jgi:hypothetical protein